MSFWSFLLPNFSPVTAIGLWIIGIAILSLIFLAWIIPKKYSIGGIVAGIMIIAGGSIVEDLLAEPIVRISLAIVGACAVAGFVIFYEPKKKVN